MTCKYTFKSFKMYIVCWVNKLANVEAKLGSFKCKTDEFFSKLLIVHLFAFSIS